MCGPGSVLWANLHPKLDLLENQEVALAHLLYGISDLPAYDLASHLLWISEK